MSVGFTVRPPLAVRFMVDAPRPPSREARIVGFSYSMLAYALKVGTEAALSEALYADGLGDAIDRAIAIVRERPEHADETDARLTGDDVGRFCLGSSLVTDVPAG